MGQLVGGKMNNKKFIISLCVSLMLLVGVIILNHQFAIFDVKSILIGSILGYTLTFVTRYLKSTEK